MCIRYPAPGYHSSNEASSSHNRVAKVNRDAFRSGGGTDGDFDKYDSNHDGVLDRDELEARAAEHTVDQQTTACRGSWSERSTRSTEPGSSIKQTAVVML